MQKGMSIIMGKNIIPGQDEDQGSIFVGKGIDDSDIEIILHKHTRNVNGPVFPVWNSPDRFTKNPDIVEIEGGRLLLVYSDNDAHWSQENQILTILASDDKGENWFKLSEVDRAELKNGDERLVTPRLSSFSDGRLAVLIDHNDYGHFHEEQPFGNWLYWSHDGGVSWSEHIETEIPGFEPDRIIELPNKNLCVVSHVMRRTSQEFAVVFTTSEDGGKTWKEYSTVAHDGYSRFCEGAIVLLDGGKELACFMRENHCCGEPGFVAFSRDNGKNWTKPVMTPFHFHRPYSKQLPDGRVLVAGRNLLGGVGTYAWCGDIKKEAGFYEIGGPYGTHDVELKEDGLQINNGKNVDCKYTLLPPENSFSEILFEAKVKVEGEDDVATALISISKITLWNNSFVLYIAPNRLTFGQAGADHAKYFDMRRERHIKIVMSGGIARTYVDSELVINHCVFREDCARVKSLFYSTQPGDLTWFGQCGDSGKSTWSYVRYKVKNPTRPDYTFEWSKDDGLYPDQYQRDRLTLIHANRNPAITSGYPDHGYCSWVMLDDGRIMFVDYTNLGTKQGKSRLIGCYLDPKEL